MKRNWSLLALGALLSTVFLAAGAAQAQVPPDIEAELVKMGHIVDPGCTAKLYRPMMPAKDVDYQIAEMAKTKKPSNEVPIYPGVTVYRDMSFGPNPKDVVDIFVGDKGGASRRVLMYVPGGAGNKIELQSLEANAFYDNIARWATENGMIGVLMQRHGAAPTPGQPADFYAGGKDVSAMVQWVQANISKYHGNPKDMFIWAQSAGNGPLGIYIGHPELNPNGVGVKGVIFMSGQFSILRPDGTNPVPMGAGGGRGGFGGAARGAAPGGGAAANPLAGAGASCGLSGGANSAEGVLAGRTPDQPGGQAAPAARGGGGGGAARAAAGGPGGARGAGPGGPGGAARGAGGRGGPQISQEEQISRSSLPALEKGDVKVFLAAGTLDIGLNPEMTGSTFNIALHEELCKLDGPNAKDGKGHCPMMLYEQGESHMSEVFSIDTPDKTVSGPILAWMKSIK